MEMTGRLFVINTLSDKSSQLVIKKQVRGKAVLYCYSVFGKAKKMVDDLKLQKNEKITILYFQKASLYKGKWYNDIWAEKVERFVDKPKWYEKENVKKQEQMFQEDSFIKDPNNYIIDEKTGRVIL